MPDDDAELIRRFARNQDEDAFREIVSRHLPLVHSAALRQALDPDLARDISQSVFIILARKAAKLDPKTVLSGWLYRTARFAAHRALQAEQRRAAREHAACQMNDPDPDTAAWALMEPELDEAMSRLGDKDRDAILLRFFENRSLGEVGLRLGVSEDAAQKRVSRALEKLRRFFRRRSIPISAAAISAALADKAVAALPAGVANAFSSTALLQASAAATITLPLAQTTLEAMTWTKLKTTAVAAVALVAAGTPAVIQQQTVVELRAENRALAARTNELAANQTDNAELERLQLELDKYKKLAAEVHELRARLAALQRDQDSGAKQLAALDSENNRLKASLAARPEPQENRAYEDAKAMEEESFRIRITEMKELGLLLHNWLAANPDTLPKSVPELAESQGITDRDKLNDLGGRLKLYPHAPGAPAPEGYAPVVIAERLPTHTVDGKQLWIYTMSDGSVLTSGTPLTEDGFLQVRRGN